MPSQRLYRVVSGGQTGVDRAALDAARHLGYEIGGWCPKGRRAEDGRISDDFPLSETPSARYGQRTEYNVREADGTLIIAAGELTGGTALTRTIARRLKKPLMILDPDGSAETAALWIAENGIAVLNVAGPRESGAPGIYRTARALMSDVLAAVANR